ncbi:hypothetical protein [Cecembia rubra]|uniref:hypothetical protein n=1 Tax=Cecembia rubra TaxID=1485585 RepID=UPI002715167A|nr:hypothetical protein [Cecembia rubra]
MDAGNIIYLVAIIIYFIYTALKKGKPEGEIEKPAVPNEQQEQRRPVSFEDLLKEIRSGQQQLERDLQQTGQGKAAEEKPVAQMTSAEKPLGNRPQKIKQPKAYEQFQGEISEREMPKLRTLNEQISLEASLEGIKSSLKSETLEKVKKENRYRQLLKDPRSVKDAVILSEVLTKKYF